MRDSGLEPFKYAEMCCESVHSRHQPLCDERAVWQGLSEWRTTLRH
jgi:hypothetical protein